MIYLGWILGGMALLSLLFLLCLGRGLGRSLGIMAGNFVLGLGSLYLVNAAGPVSGFAIPVNILTLAGSGFLGLPGTMLGGAVQVLAGM